MQVRVTKLGHIGITVRDIDRSVDFYTRMLGMRLTEQFEYSDEVGHGVAVVAGAFVRCDSTHHAISIFKLKDGLIPADSPDGSAMAIGLHHIAFELATPEDLLAKLNELRSAGVPIVNCRTGGPGNQPRFYARDPDGILLEFYWSIDAIGWDGLPREYSPIQEIDLEKFDFDAHIEKREQDAERMLETVPAAVAKKS